MSERALRDERGALAEMDMRAAMSIRRAIPLVRKSRWQCKLPTNPGEVTTCWFLGFVIAAEIAALVIGVMTR